MSCQVGHSQHSCPCLEILIIVSLVQHSTHNKLLLLGKSEPLGSGFPFQGVELVEGPALERTPHPLPSSGVSCPCYPFHWGPGMDFGKALASFQLSIAWWLRARTQSQNVWTWIQAPWFLTCVQVSSLGFSALAHQIRAFVSPPQFSISMKWNNVYKPTSKSHVNIP